MVKPAESASPDTLIVNGAADTIVDAADVEGTVGRIPRAELRVVPDVGHFVHFERPETVEIYVDFFNRALAVDRTDP